MATSPTPNPVSCTSYGTAGPNSATEPPELDYRYFTPEFLDELEEHYQAIAVSQFSA